MYYLLWIGESADTIHAPTCLIATDSEYTMFEYCSKFIDEIYKENQYVVMCIKTVPTLPLTSGKVIFTQTTRSVHDFINTFKEAYPNEI